MQGGVPGGGQTCHLSESQCLGGPAIAEELPSTWWVLAGGALQEEVHRNEQGRVGSSLPHIDLQMSIQWETPGCRS